MPSRASKRRGFTQIAKAVVDAATGQGPKVVPLGTPPENGTRNPAALTLTERGSKGARARNAKLTAQQRRDIARKAARARNAKLTAKQRKDIARRAAERRWE